MKKNTRETTIIVHTPIAIRMNTDMMEDTITETGITKTDITEINATTIGVTTGDHMTVIATIAHTEIVIMEGDTDAAIDSCRK